ncbi:PEP/pyruvate-binding domain-containing protein [Streptomyces sp. NPDC058525]|uniref:PEP/pyruvate-binding domain-containing protein n=1 Tax=Streptomyces sp. NPDC058525 TaxID=3346538 RepID=UPI00364F64B3
MTFIAELASLGRDDLALAGGKGANLGESLRGGFRVPDGFVVTTDAYAAALRAAGLDPAGLLTGDDGARLRAAIEAIDIPERLEAELIEAYVRLGGGPVAVRSSATAEDLPGAAFAGQQDTYLGVLGEAHVADAVRRCWASLWTDRAIAYRRKRAVAEDGVRIAVVVQRMVDAQTAGVMFTADPVSGARDVLVVDASSGLGEAVVSGLVTPDHYVLGADGRVRERTAGRHEVVLRSGTDGGVTRAPGAPHAFLPDVVLAELARLGTDVAQHFGRPQDIEWAYADGQLWLLQARPMTALPPPPVRLNRAQRLIGSILLEMLPYRPYPIDMTTWLPHGPAGLMAEMMNRFGFRGGFQGFLTEQDGVVDRMIPKPPQPTPRAVLAPFRLVRLARRYDAGEWTNDPRYTRFVTDIAELSGRDVTALEWARLVRMPRRTLELGKPMALLRGDYLPRLAVTLARLWPILAVLRRTSLLGDLIGGGRTRTEDANRMLEALAEQARREPALAEAVDRLDPAALDPFPEFRARFETFLAEYGSRETETVLLVTSPTWGESPEVVLGLISALASAPKADAPTSRADAALHQLLPHPLLRGRRARGRIERLVTTARTGLAFREDSHFAMTASLPVLRRALLEIGQRLREAGVLADREDVYHLRLEEIEALGDPAALTEPQKERLRATVRARTARRDELDGVRLIDPAAVFPRKDGGDALVTGTPASSGTVTGPVRIVRGPAEFARLRSGDVLVCPQTNPSWTPLFQRAAAVVVDSGAVASHAAIVAREYGIPAVMGTANGCSVLTDGRRVTVDGGTGRVTAAPEPGQTP